MLADRPGGRLWPIALAATVFLVAADFVRYPFVGSPEGRASAPARELSIVLPLGDAGTPVVGDVRALAAAMSGRTHSAELARSGTGAARTILSFARRDDRDGRQLLLLTSSALAEIQRGRRQPASGYEEADANAALAALKRLRPIGGVAVDRMVVAVRRGGPARFADLAAHLHVDPDARIAGIGADAGSKMALAGLVRALGVDGRVPYRVFPSGADAALALSGGDVDFVLTPRSYTLAERRRGGIRLLPGGRHTAPVWSVLVGPPALDPGVRRKLTYRMGHALARGPWRRHAARHGLRRPSVRPKALGAFIARETRHADGLAALAAGVPERLR